VKKHPSMTLAILLTSFLGAASGRAEDCALNSTQASPFRFAGTAHVKISGSGFSVDLPAQPAVCGASAVEDLNDFGKVHAGDGYLFETCVKQGVVEVFSNQPGAVRSPQKDALGKGVALFAIYGNGGFTRSYTLDRATSNDHLEIGAALGSAKLSASLVEAASKQQVRVDVEFTCSKIPMGPPVAAAAKLTPVPLQTSAALQAATPPSRQRTAGCFFSYGLGAPSSNTSLVQREHASPATAVDACIKDLEKDVQTQCIAKPNTPKSWVSGNITLRPAGDGTTTVSQVFHTTCGREALGEGVCFAEPCDAALKNTPGCQSCPAGKTLSVQCECVYPPGTEHSCDVGVRMSADSWTHHSETADVVACRAEGELEMKRRCKKGTPGADPWGDASVNVWKNGNNQVERDVARCSDVLAGKGFCKGPGCTRPCPKDQCLSDDNRCVTPGGPLAGLCGDPEGIFCNRCK
jgi:hypothetical protein